METMRTKVINLKPGTILCWKSYNIFTRLWNKLTGKSMKYNRFSVVAEPVYLLSFEDYTCAAYEPVRAYNAKELTKLKDMIAPTGSTTAFKDIQMMVNVIRPNTFDNVATMDECKYYKKQDLDANSTKYIFQIG